MEMVYSVSLSNYGELAQMLRDIASLLDSGELTYSTGSIHAFPVAHSRVNAVEIVSNLVLIKGP